MVRIVTVLITATLCLSLLSEAKGSNSPSSTLGNVYVLNFQHTFSKERNCDDFFKVLSRDLGVDDLIERTEGYFFLACCNDTFCGGPGTKSKAKTFKGSFIFQASEPYEVPYVRKLVNSLDDTTVDGIPIKYFKYTGVFVTETLFSWPPQGGQFAIGRTIGATSFTELWQHLRNIKQDVEASSTQSLIAYLFQNYSTKDTEAFIEKVLKKSRLISANHNAGFVLENGAIEPGYSFGSLFECGSPGPNCVE